MAGAKVKSYSLKLTPEQSKELATLLKNGNYERTQIPYTEISVKGDNLSVNLYTSGKVLIQGEGTEEFVQFILEPQITKEARLGYEDVLDSGANAPHIGVDESGKGDYFGPLVIAAVYTNETLSKRMREFGARDCKVLSDAQVFSIGAKIRGLLGTNRFSIISIGPEKYNEIYAKRKNGNVILAWGHARSIENVLERVPSCPRAVADQFGNEKLIRDALMEKGKKIVLDQHHKAESDIAVAAASILAREHFLRALESLGNKYGVKLPKGAAHSTTLPAARTLIERHGEDVLRQVAKVNFRTTNLALGRRQD